LNHEQYEKMRNTVLLLMLFICPVIWAQPNPTVTGDNMICPMGTGTVTTQTFDSYQWLIRYYGSTITNPISGATAQTLVMDYYDFAASYVSVQVWQNGQSAISEEHFVDGWVFLPPTVISDGNFTVGPTGESILCPGDTMYFTMNMPYTTNITWFKDNEEIVGENAPTLVVTQPGNYYVTGAPEACPEYIQGPGVDLTVQFCSIPALNPTISGDDILCPEGEGLLTTQSYDNYQWYVRHYGTTTPILIPGATQQTLEIDYFEYAASYLSVQVWQNGQTATSDEYFVDGWAFSPPVVFSDGEFEIGPDGEIIICPGDTVFLELNVPYTVNITWYQDGEVLQGETGQQLVVTVPGEYYVTGAPAQCPDFISGPGLTIPVVLCAGSAPEPGISGDDILCPDGYGELTTEEYDSYQWFIRYLGTTETNPIEGATEQTLVIDFYDFAASYISVQVWQNGQTGVSDEFFVDGWAFAPATVMSTGNFEISPEGEAIICPGDTMYLTLNMPYTVNITWYRDGEILAGENDNELMVTTAGNYFVTGAPEQCPDYIQSPGLEIPVIYCVDVQTQQPGNGKPLLIIYPNPAMDKLQIESEVVIKGDYYVIYDLLGREVYVDYFHSGALTIDVKHLNAGIYLLKTASIPNRTFRFVKL
jgi:hypothetical protein